MGFGQEMEGCGRFMKTSMILTNILIFMGGALAFGLALWTALDRGYLNELLGSNLFAGAVYVLLVTGAIACCASFFGCIGAVKEIKCVLLTYFILLFLLFVTMLVGGALAYVYREKASAAVEQEMLSTLRLYGNRREYTRAWDETQSRLHCCGVTSWRDWKDRIPASCCLEAFGGRKLPCQDAPDRTTLYDVGCVNVTTTFVREHSAVVGGAAVGVACIMILGMIFSCSLFMMIE